MRACCANALDATTPPSNHFRFQIRLRVGAFVSGHSPDWAGWFAHGKARTREETSGLEAAFDELLGDLAGIRVVGAVGNLFLESLHSLGADFIGLGDDLKG